MPLLIDGLQLSNAVLSDGQPRQATADDGTEHMLFRDGEVVRSVLLADWPAEQTAQAARDAARAKRIALRQSISDAAQAHAGKRANGLTLPELRDLVLVLLEERGMLDDDGNVA